jgi:hypothetical protein
VLVKWLEISYYSNGKKQYTDQLGSLTSTGYEFRTRVNAMNALKRCTYLNEILIENMIDAVLSPKNRLGGVTADILQYEAALPKIRKLLTVMWPVSSGPTGKRRFWMLKISKAGFVRL